MRINKSVYIGTLLLINRITMADMISIKGKPGKVKDKKYVNKIERERNLPGYCL